LRVGLVVTAASRTWYPVVIGEDDGATVQIVSGLATADK